MTTVLTSASTLKSSSSKKLFSCTQFELSKILSSKNVALAEMNLDEECDIKEDDEFFFSSIGYEFDSSFIGGPNSKREILSLI